MTRYLSNGVAPIGGSLKSDSEDFRVTEVPLYEPAGEGPHRYLEVTKKGWTTESLRRAVAARLRLNSKDIGYAGLKDKHAVTIQRYSFPADWSEVQATLESLDGVLDVVEVGLHRNKLRRGHLRGNRFRVVVREVHQQALQQARQVQDILTQQGWPNFFGEQRFGGEGGNAEIGRRLVTGEKMKVRGFERDLMISAYQSLLFNRYLRHRIQSGFFGQVLEGDICAHLPSGGFFEVDDPEPEQARLKAFDISTTGPIFGRKARLAAGGQPLLWEQALLDEENLKPTDFPAPGSRRRLRLPLQEFSVSSVEGDSLCFEFFLPAGSYATVLLDEFLKLGERLW